LRNTPLGGKTTIAITDLATTTDCNGSTSPVLLVVVVVVAGVAGDARQERLEGTPKVAVTESVYDRIENGIEVADPEEGGYNKRRCCVDVSEARTITTHRRRDVPRKERKPAEQERAHNYSQRLGGFVFALEATPLVRVGCDALLMTVVFEEGGGA